MTKALSKNVIAIRDAMIAAHTSQQENYGEGKTPLPHSFRYGRGGCIERLVSTALDGAEIWGFLCSPIEFIATTEDADGKAPGLLVRIRNDSGRWHQIAFPRSALVNGDTLLSDLVHNGLKFAPVGKDPSELKRLFMHVAADKRARCVPHIGWHEKTFVLPDEVIGQPQDLEVVFQPPYSINHYYCVGGTFDGWKSEIACRALCNSRLEFAISASFIGPLLKLARLDGGGWHWRGASSTGKSTLLHVSASTWGGGGINGFVRSWRTTDNALEGTALHHNDTLLPLDEIAEVDSRTAFRTAYMLANGQGKARSNKTGELRVCSEWRTSFLSTGEIGLAAKIAEDGRRATAGQEVRVIDIPVDAGAGMGAFEKLHGFNRPGDFAEALRDSAQRHYGHAARKFLAELVKDIEGISADLRNTIAEFVENYCPAGSDGQVRRVARRFALAACAGGLAIKFGVLPWPEETPFLAAERCLNDWLRVRGGVGPREQQDAIDAVFDFLTRHAARFQSFDNPGATVFERAGFYRDTNDGRQWFIFRDAFRRDICAKSGLDPDFVADILTEKGLLQKSADGKRTRSVALPGCPGKIRVYSLQENEVPE